MNKQHSIIIFLSFILLGFSIKLIGQNDYYEENFLRYDDFEYSANIKSVQLIKGDAFMLQPTILLNSNETLTLYFDDLNAGTGNYFYKLILCNHDWTPSTLMPMEYIEGLQEIMFNNVQLSYNTTKSYSHYRVSIPDKDMKITRSGNYLLVVYPEGKPEKPILTRRFYVYEESVAINASVVVPRATQKKLNSHEIFLSIDKGEYYMPQIYNNLIVKIQQNNRKDNIQVLDKPKRINGNIIVYSDVNDLYFEAGNEFRKMDIRSFVIPAGSTTKIEYDTNGYHISLETDIIRTTSNYINYQDINGRFKILNWDNTQRDENIEADYAYVHVRLAQPKYQFEGSYYIVGDFSNWRLDKNFQLDFNSQKMVYEKSIFLKQAYYDYQYVYLPFNEKTATTLPVEGSFSETENDYSIFVYYRDPGELNDKLIAYRTINSRHE